MNSITLTQLAMLCRNEIDKLSFPINPDALQDTFKRISEQVIFQGHFDVPQGEPIYPVDIEFYFHQEGTGKDKIKDPIMYHTFDHEIDNPSVYRRTKSLISSGRYTEEDKDQALPYFSPGTLNPHVSGIDLTFENEEKKYRASFLIRGYKVGNLSEATIRNSTFIYDDLLFAGIPDTGTGISWVIDKDNHCKVDAYIRQNVYKYEKDENGVYLKDSNDPKDPNDPQKPKGKFVKKRDGNKKLVRSTRYWRFKLKL